MLGKARCSPKVPCAHVLLGSPASQLRKFRDGAGSGRRWSREWTSAWPRLLADPWSSSPDLGLDREEVGCRWLDPGRRDPSLPPRPRSAFTDPGRALGGFEMGRPPVRTVAFLSSLLTGPVRATLLREDPASLLDRGSPTAAGSREHRQGGGGAVGGQEEAEGPRRAALDADRGGARGWLEKGKERETSGMRVGEVVPSFLGKGWGIVGGAIMPFHSSFWGWEREEGIARVSFTHCTPSRENKAATHPVCSSPTLGFSIVSQDDAALCTATNVVSRCRSASRNIETDSHEDDTPCNASIRSCFH
jgi:hypothetical protein